MYLTLILSFCGLLSVAFATIWCYLWALRYNERKFNPKLHKFPSTSLPFYKRSYVHWTDLLDPSIRADPHLFNQHLHKLANNYPNNIIPVRHERNTFLIVKYDHVKAMLTKQNEHLLSSNPFADNRLIAPNTMDFDKHAAIMKYIKSYYSTVTVNKQIPVIEQIIQNIVNKFIQKNKNLGKKSQSSNLNSNSNANSKGKSKRNGNTKTTKATKATAATMNEEDSEITAEESAKLLDNCDFMKHVARQIVMQTALYMIGYKPPALQSENILDNISENEKICQSVKFPEISQEIVDEFIELNDIMIDLVAPLGGIGNHFDYSILRLFKVLLNAFLYAFVPTIQLVFAIGIKNTWNIIRPDLSLLKIPNNMQPRLQIWFKPHLLDAVPKYFLLLNYIYCKQINFDKISGGGSGGRGKQNKGGGSGNGGNNVKYTTKSVECVTVLNSLRKGELNGDITRDEILVTLVQLMVNMTTSNGIGSMIFRLADSFLNENDSGYNSNNSSNTNKSRNERKSPKNKNKANVHNRVNLGDLIEAENEFGELYQLHDKKAMSLIEEVLRYDAPLHRLPRRCRINMKASKNYLKYKLEGLPNGLRFNKNSNLILMIGAANCDPAYFGNNKKNKNDDNNYGTDDNMDWDRIDDDDDDEISGFEFDAMRYYNNNNNNNNLQTKALTFGFGVHFCLGYWLVKREMLLTLKCLLNANIEKIQILHYEKMDDVDVGNYGFRKLHVKFG